MEIMNTLNNAGSAVQCGARYGAGQLARGTGFGMAWVGEKLFNGGMAINKWGNKQVKIAQRMWALADEVAAEVEAEEKEQLKKIARDNHEQHAQKNQVDDDIDVDAYCS